LPIERAPKTIALYGGIPDLKEVPHSLIARAYRKALRRESVLGYTSDARGHERLRRAVAQLVRENRGVAASPDEVIITRGSQMGIDLSLRAVLRPGDVVCVEELGYRPAWSALQRSGAKIVPIPIDEDGMRIDALANVANVRLVYVTPHHQYPTTVMLTAARRMELLELARKNRFAILEDDYDYEFHYEGRSVLPLASADEAGVVVYMGTLSKILAPGLRLGFVIAPKPFVDRLARERFLIDRQGDHALELAVADLIEDDELGRHARKMRRLYQSRRDVLAKALRKLDALSFSVPNGGMALWARVDSSIDVDAWAERAKDRGVLFQPGRIFSLTSRRIQAARFGFASTSERDLEEAGRRLRSCATSRGTRAARD
jgi:GntR family transcriptional regulator/MocR family aminotransferase